MPLDETIALASTLDAINAQVLTGATRPHAQVSAHAGASDERRTR
jgi:hypothetical protein